MNDVSYVMVEVGYLWRIANSLVKSIVSLKETEGDHMVSIELLSTQAIELLFKSYHASNLCLDNKNENQQNIREIVDKQFKLFSHDLKKIIDNDQILKDTLNIEFVDKESNEFTSEFRIFFKDKSVLVFKELESIRYGSFAKNKNIMNGFMTIEDSQLSFLQNLSLVTHEKVQEILRSLKE